jgi:hypothetical protein
VPARKSTSLPPVAAPAAPERWYKVAEIAELWQISPNTVRKLFEHEDVMRIGEPARLVGGRQKKYKRRFFILRIPERVFRAKQQELMNGGRRSSVSGGNFNSGGATGELHAAS